MTFKCGKGTPLKLLFKRLCHIPELITSFITFGPILVHNYTWWLGKRRDTFPEKCMVIYYWGQNVNWWPKSLGGHVNLLGSRNLWWFWKKHHDVSLGIQVGIPSLVKAPTYCQILHVLISCCICTAIAMPNRSHFGIPIRTSLRYIQAGQVTTYTWGPSYNPQFTYLPCSNCSDFLVISYYYHK